MDDITKAYIAIYDAIPETCVFEGVRRVSGRTNESGDMTYSFIAVVAFPTTIPDVEADDSECLRVAQLAKQQFDLLGGPDVSQRITWKKDDGTLGKFDFAAHLAPENVLSFECKDGIMRVTCKAYGTFY